MDDEDFLGGDEDVGSQAENIHIRIQQRNGRKTLTTLQGIGEGMYAFYSPVYFLMLTPNLFFSTRTYFHYKNMT